MVAVRVQITKFTSDAVPGWVECKLIDAWGKEWLFEEKIPVVACDDLGPQSEYPQSGIIACEIINQRRDEHGRDIVLIDTEKPWGVGSLDGVFRFEVITGQLVDD